METTIKLDGKTRDKLAAIGAKNETYDTIINRLIEGYYRKTKAIK